MKCIRVLVRSPPLLCVAPGTCSARELEKKLLLIYPVPQDGSPSYGGRYLSFQIRRFDSRYLTRVLIANDTNCVLNERLPVQLDSRCFGEYSC